MYKKLLKKTASVFVTVILILSTVLCLVVVSKSVSKGNVSIFGYKFFYVLTGSMEPTIHAGALTVTKESASGEYEIGDIITFKSKNTQIYGQPNTHRIVGEYEKFGKHFYVTQGDANNTPDPEPVSQSEIYGKVVWYSGRLNWLGSVITFLLTPFGFLLVILLPILLLTISQLKEFTSSYKEALKAAAMQSIIENNSLKEATEEEKKDDTDERKQQ